MEEVYHHRMNYGQQLEQLLIEEVHVERTGFPRFPEHELIVYVIRKKPS